jgi:RHS repeat-associated protein
LELTGIGFQYGGIKANKYLYNGKELLDDQNLNLYDYGARYYDPVIGRWTSPDPMADHPNQIDKSPYAAMWNNPIRYNDPDGRCPNCITGLIGAGVGALVGGGIEVATQLYNSGSVTDWSAVGGSALQGGITGGAAGFTGGASLVVTAGVAGTANAVGGAANRAIQGQETTIGDVALDATIGSALGAGGKLVGNAVSGAVDDLSNAVKGKLGEGLTNAKYLGKGYVNTGKAVVETGNKTATGRVQVAKYDHAFKNPFTGKQLTVESKFNTSGLTGNQKAAAGNVTTPGGLIISNPTSKHVGQAAGAATSGTGAGVVTQKERDY